MLRKQQPKHSKSRSRSQRQSLGRQRRSTARSLNGMPTSDSTAPELRDDTRYHLDHAMLPPTTPPSGTPHYRRTPYHRQNHPSISSRHRDIKQALLPIDSNSVNNPDLLLYQRHNIQPTIQQRDEQNNDMSFYDTSYAGSSISSNSIFTSSPELHPARRNRHLPRQDLIDSLPPFHQIGQSYIGSPISTSTQSHGVARRKPPPVQSPAAARGRSTTSQDFDFTRRKSQPALPPTAAAARRANRKSPPLSSPTSRRTVRKLGREDCPTISRNNDEYFNDIDHDDHGDDDADADDDDDNAGSMPDLQERSPYDSSDSEDDDEDDDDGSMPDLQERSPYCGDSEDDDDNAPDDFSGGSTGDFSCDLSGNSTGDFSCDSAGDFSCDLSGAPPRKKSTLQPPVPTSARRRTSTATTLLGSRRRKSTPPVPTSARRRTSTATTLLGSSRRKSTPPPVPTSGRRTSTRSTSSTVFGSSHRKSPPLSVPASARRRTSTASIVLDASRRKSPPLSGPTSTRRTSTASIVLGASRRKSPPLSGPISDDFLDDCSGHSEDDSSGDSNGDAECYSTEDGEIVDLTSSRRRPKLKSQSRFISLVPGAGARVGGSGVARSNESTADSDYNNNSSMDGSEDDYLDEDLYDDESVVVVESGSGDDGFDDGVSEVHRADAAFWSSANCPKGLYLVAHTEDEAHVIEDRQAGQVYAFKQLTTIDHLQVRQEKLGSFLRTTLAPDVPVHFYRNHRNHTNSFCAVMNEKQSVASVIDSLDFVTMHKHVSAVNPKDVHGCTRQKDQTRVSYGYATNTCMRRDESGSSVPNLLKGTSSIFSQHIFEGLSSIFDLPDLPSWACYEADPLRQEYAQAIAKNNKIEGATIHQSSPKNPCASHRDGNNPDCTDEDQLSLVVGASKWVKGVRVGATGYFRKSISDAIIRKAKNAPMLDELLQVYSQFPDDRKHMDPETLALYTEKGNVIDKHHVSVPCNLNPLGFQSLFVHSTCRIVDKFRFTLPMILSSLICMDVVPNCAYFYDLAVDDLVRGRIQFEGDPWLIGRFIALNMLRLRNRFFARNTSPGGKSKKIALYRYNCYKGFETESDIPNESDWIDRTLKKLAVIMGIWILAPAKPNLASISGVYESCSKLYQDTTYGLGHLQAKHQFAVLSYFGCLPDWIRDYAPISGRVLGFFQKRYPELKWSKEPGRCTMTTIQTFFEHRIREWWTYSTLENVMCKVYRILSPKGSDSHFVDVHRVDEVLLVQGQSSLSISFPDGELLPLDSNYLCNEWELVDGMYVAPSDIANQIFANSLWTTTSKFPSLGELLVDDVADRIMAAFPLIQKKSSLAFSF